MTTETSRINRRRSFYFPSSRTVTLSVAVGLFVVLCALPTLYMLAASFIGADGGLVFDNYRRLLLDARQRQLLLNSATLGAGTAVLATLIGAPLGFLLARAEIPAKNLFRLLLVVPLVIPPYILALAWTYLGGANGLVTRLFGDDFLAVWTHSLSGAVVALAIAFYPLAMLATEAAARRVDGHLEEAALLVAAPRLVFWRITVPLIAPGAAAAALLIFVLALSEFGVPGLLRVPVFTTEIFTAFAALYDFGAATSLTVLLLFAALLAGSLAKLIVGEKFLTSPRGSCGGLPLVLGKWQWLALVGLGIVCLLFVVLPILVLALETGEAGKIFTAFEESRTAIFGSLLYAIGGATLSVLLGLPLGYGRARARARLGGLIDLVLIVAFAVPGAIIGIGLIGIWNRPGAASAVYQSPVIIIIGYLARFVPVAALLLAASIRQVSTSREEAAEVAGASWLSVFTRIVLPQIKTGLVAAWVIVFIFAFGEMATTILVAPPGESTLPIRIYTIIANTPSSTVAALSLMQVAIALLPLIALSFFIKRDEREF